MPISFGCEFCGRRLKARDEHAGRRTRCPGCGLIQNVPSSEEELIPLEDADDGTDYRLIDEPTDNDPKSPAMSWSRPRPAPPLRPQTRTDLEPEPAFEDPLGSPSLREYSYALLALALIPLLISFMGEKEPELSERIRQTVDSAAPEQRERILPILNNPESDLKELLAVLPDGKLAGAHLSNDSAAHWLYGLISAGVFLAFLVFMFTRERVPTARLVGVGLFTGTVGIVLLLAFQWCAGLRPNRIPGGWIGLIFLIIRFIGWSYECADDPNGDFWTSAFGFTFGVGLCEEICKAIPLIAMFHAGANLGWRGACLMGLASGVGFGVSEGIMYSQGMYNGVVGLDVYVLRFVSCVALHAMWAGSVGMTIYSRREEIEDAEGIHGFAWVAIKVVVVPMILHGLYDTMLKKDMNLWALAVSLATFGWFAFLVEACRGLAPGKRTATA